LQIIIITVDRQSTVNVYKTDRSVGVRNTDYSQLSNFCFKNIATLRHQRHSKSLENNVSL